MVPEDRDAYVSQERALVDGQAQVGLTSDEYGRSQCAAVLIAHLKDGTQVVNIWSSKGDLWSWLKRPVFKGIPLRWFGKSGHVNLNPVNDMCH
jgi:hypothetical protein